MRKVIKGKLFSRVIIVVVLAIAWITFIMTPLTNDIKVFSASARQASFINKGLLYDAYNAWELKSVFSRVVMYFIYKCAIVFSEFGTLQFERMVAFVYSVLAGLICMVAAYLLDEAKRFENFVLFVLTFLLTQTCAHMQVEMTGVLLLILAFAIYANARKNKQNQLLKVFLSGIIIGSLFFFKSILIIMSVCFVAIISIWNLQKGYSLSWKRFWTLVSGSVTTILIGFVSIIIINPNEIEDILNASIFQNTLFSGEGISLYILGKFIYSFIYACFRFPMVMLGLCLAACNLVNEIKNKNHFLIFMHILVWMIPALFIVVSNKYFPYHFYIFAFSAVMEIIIWNNNRTFEVSVRVERLALLSVIITIISCSLDGYLLTISEKCYFALFCSLMFALIVAIVVDKNNLCKIIFKIIMGLGIASYILFISITSSNVKTYISLLEKAYSQDTWVKDFIGENEMLYLDDGAGAYIIGAKSYLKYFFPLPVQRIDDASKYSDIKCRKETLEKIHSYNGQYISVYDSWFFDSNRNLDIKQKIENEYQYVNSIVKYAPTNNLFANDTEKVFKYIDIYIKNEKCVDMKD